MKNCWQEVSQIDNTKAKVINKPRKLKSSTIKKDSFDSNSSDKGNLQYDDSVSLTVLDEIEKLTHIDNSEVVCVYCKEPTVYFCIGSCNHFQMCPICTIRNVLIYERKFCGICKQKLEKIYVVNQIKDYNQLEAIDLTLFKSLKNKFFFENFLYYKMWERIFNLECTLCPIEIGAFGTLSELEAHLAIKHERYFCQVCLTRRNCFLCQQGLYTRDSLNKHMKFGDSKQALEPHRICDYCKIYFFDNSDILDHCNKIHERCHVCIRHGYENYYYQDYPNLEKHFFDFHFPCTDNECMERKFVVFECKAQLMAHVSKKHARKKGVFVIGDASDLRCGFRPRTRSHPTQNPLAVRLDNESPVFHPDSVLQFDITEDITPSVTEINSARSHSFDEEFPSLSSDMRVNRQTNNQLSSTFSSWSAISSGHGHIRSTPAIFNRNINAIAVKFQRLCKKNLKTNSYPNGDLKIITQAYLNERISVVEFYEYFDKLSSLDAFNFCTELANIFEDAKKKTELLSLINSINAGSAPKKVNNSSDSTNYRSVVSSGREMHSINSFDNCAESASADSSTFDVDLEFPSLTPATGNEVFSNFRRTTKKNFTKPAQSIWRQN